MNIAMEWYQLTIDETLKKLKTSRKGLSQEDSLTRLQLNGLNIVAEEERRSALQIFLSQFRDLMVLILLMAAVIAGLIGDLIDTLVILTITLLNAFIGFFQELQTQHAISALKSTVKARVKVHRDNEVVIVNEEMIVAGDIIVLEAGNLVPADLRIISCSQMSIDESTLTGESVPVSKMAGTIPQKNLTLGDQKNMAFKGTYVIHGHAMAVVVNTGMDTQFGRISSMLQSKKTSTPLQKNMVDFSKKLSLIILILCSLFFISNWLLGKDMLVIVLTSISLAIAAIPEALPTIIVLSLAFAASRMLKHHALVRKFSAVETLGAVKYICTDKTGTITKNQMEVTELYINNELIAIDKLNDLKEQPLLHLMLHAFALNNDVIPDKGLSGIGESTEMALMRVAREQLIDPRKFKRLAEIPFDGERKLMTTFHSLDNKIISFTKGAPELLIKRCVHTDTPSIDEVIRHMAARGQRTIGFAYRIWEALPEEAHRDHCEQGLTFLGLAGMLDPPRENIRNAIAACRQAGINTVMITGDHPLTARSIGLSIGLIDAGNDYLLSGQQLLEMDDHQLLSLIDAIRIYARVSPEQKLRIIKLLRTKGHYTAMIGDGVNDAPALKSADIGIAMGTGTDFTKSQADIVLLDDNFSTILKAVAEGRRIYDNIIKAIKYLLTTNSGELWTLMICPLAAMPLTLLPIHILWTNLISDGLPAIALAYEKAEPGNMRRSPRAIKEGVFSQGRGIFILVFGLLIAMVVLFIQGWAIENGKAWRTMAFNSLCLSQMGSALSARSEKRSLLELGLFSNKPLLYAVCLVFVLQFLITYLPILQPIFHTEALSMEEFIIVGCASSVVFLCAELYKVLPLKLKSNEKNTGYH
jgi:Ca2+-transporting ATPase